MTHLGVEVGYGLQQLLHGPLQGRRVAAGKDAQRQSVCVEPGEVADDPGVCGNQPAALRRSVRLRVRLSPVRK